jgi:hypothetical protein
MRKILAAVAVAAGIFAVGMPGRAQAMPVTAPATLGSTLATTPIEQAAYICRPRRVCGPFGCGWRRSCFYTPGPYAYYGWGWGGGPRWRHYGGGWRGGWHHGGRHWR